jgi:PAS domain S-box-containing protein
MPIKRKPDEQKVDNFITLLNFIADPVIIIDQTGHFLLMNKAYEKATGYKNDKCQGKSSLATKELSAEDKKLLKENIKKRAAGQHIPPYEITFLDKKDPRVYEINAKKIFFNNQPSIMVNFRDVTIRKQNEQRLKENSAKMQALVNQKVREIKDNAKKIRVYFDASPDAIAVTDQNGRLLDCNDAAIKLFGYSSRAEVIDLNVAGLIPKKERVKIKSFTDKMITTGSFKNQNVVLLTKQGKKFPAELSVNAVKNVYDKSMVYITIIKDVSERRRLLEALRESEERFRVISTAALNAIFLVDDEGKVAYWNPAAEKMFGYTLQEVLGKDINQLLVPPEARILHKKILKKLAHGEKKYQGIIDARALRKDKTIISIEISATGLKLKGKEYALAIIQDVTARRKMENALKQERDLLEKVTENIGAGLGIISKDYRILWANKLLTQVHGGDVENKLCYTVFNKLDHVCEDCGVKRVFETDEAINRHDFTFLDENGNPVCIELIVTPIKDKQGKTVAGLELAIDVTEKRRLEKKT